MTTPNTHVTYALVSSMRSCSAKYVLDYRQICTLKYVLVEQVTTPKLHVTYAKAKEIQGQVRILTYPDAS